MTIQNESKEDRIARLGAVKGTVSGKQVAWKGITVLPVTAF